MTHQASGHDNSLPGIHCDVNNCVYNDKRSKCTAKEIKVGPTYAVSSSDTVCNTFKQGSAQG